MPSWHHDESVTLDPLAKVAVGAAAVALALALPLLGQGAPELTAQQAIARTFGETTVSARRVAYCESKLRPRAANWSDRHSDGSRGSFGLFQIGALHRARGESVAAFARRMFDPLQNARLAYRLSRGGRSWGPWRYCRRFA